MSETYTREDLDGLSRVELRRLAVQVHGMDNRECVNTRSEDIKDFILEKQDGGGGKSAKTSSKGRGGKSKASSKKAAPKGDNGKSKAKAKDEPAAVGDTSQLLDSIDALGKTLDEHSEVTKEMLGELGDQVAELDKKMFFLNGLAADLYKAMYEPDDLDARLEELESEYNAEGNDDSGE